ncbi:DUF3265 domain-containing protein [Vibrio parahaemolyticus]|nr:DUF3265 domain-containing protein [Vibrio parahaemolyticus]HBC3506553.1 DUF3265 domain-containing protein [Vibrio parahaemolyticus]HCE2834339.1 DUF3265 domain-containing protein [Vibrio parahaemolyticus]HCG7729478.1 DUF3265 domain-containing protein [Vibrio parahaemolyticus]HCG8090299.1 DUF3265 domain-containing protein [Vibrio parahaemolyticus]
MFAFSLAAARLVSVFLVINIVLYFNILAYAKGLKGSVLTNSSSGIQHAWHFWYAFDFGVEVQCRGLVIACFTP